MKTDGRLAFCICALTFATSASAAVPWERSEWISVAGDRAVKETSVFRWSAANPKQVRRVRWVATGLGVFNLYLNGKLIGADFLKPGYTDNRKTKYAFAYDVTAEARTGCGASNDFGVEVTGGWWHDAIVGGRGRKPAFRGLIEYTYADGTREVKGTRAAEWFGATGGPLTRAGIWEGESFDARATNVARTPAGSFVSGGCERNDEFKGEVFPAVGAKVLLREDLSMTRGPFRLKAGETNVVDFGQNCAAVPRFRFRAARGTVLTALPGEMLNDAPEGQRGCDGPPGSVYRANLRTQKSGMRLEYTFAGSGLETYLPRHTFFGYRYLSLSATGDVEIESVESVPVSSIAKDLELGRIETGDRDVNRLIANAYWGQLSNYLSVPSDCPQRNERHGWAGDTQVFAEAGSFMADTQDFFRKWMRDARDGVNGNGAFPSVAPTSCYDGGYMRLGWGDAGVIVPYQVWKQFGNAEIVRENWSAMERFVAHVAATRYETAVVGKECGGMQFADWLSFERFNGDRTVYWDYLGGCYWLWDARMMRTMGAAIGKDVAAYARMEAEVRTYLRARFVSADDGLLIPSLRTLQTATAFALKLGLIEGEAKDKSCELLRRNFREHGGCLQTGFLGTSILLDALAESGLGDVAYDVLLNHGYPGWLYSVDQGATTIWERWNSYTKKNGFGPVGMNSFNHYAYGAVVAWIYKTVAGIAADPAHPGFKVVVMQPIPDRRLGFVKAEYRSAAGLVRSAWRYEGEKWLWEFAIPSGSTAAVTLPGETSVRTYGPGVHRLGKILP